jgi:hypothetical protein
MENQGSKKEKLCLHSLNQTNKHQPVKDILHPMLMSQIIVNNPLSNLKELKLMLILLNEILGYEFQCENILLINKMKLEELISK